MEFDYSDREVIIVRASYVYEEEDVLTRECYTHTHKTK